MLLTPTYSAVMGAIETALHTPLPDGLGIPFLLWGDPGVGKTKAMEQLAARTAVPYYRLSPAERGEGQFGVVPVPIDGRLQYPAPDWVDQLGENGILFVDEITTAPPALQAPLLGLVQLKTIGSYTFPRNVRVIGAGNDPTVAAGGWDLAAPLRNRFMHLSFQGFPTDTWIDWMKGGVGAGAVEQTAMPSIEKHFEAMRPGAFASVANFIAAKPQMLHDLTDADAVAQPTRRTWEYAARFLAASKIVGASKAALDCGLAGLVGVGAASEFFNWMINNDLPLYPDLLEGRATFQPDAARADRTLSVLEGCSRILLEKEDAPAEWWTRFWGIVSASMNEMPDTTMPTVLRLFKRNKRPPIDLMQGFYGHLKSAGLV